MPDQPRGLELAVSRRPREAIHVSMDHDKPDGGLGICCAGAAMFGPGRCTCWEPVYDMDQEEPQTDVAPVEGEQCADCAYRVDSPERRNEESYAGDEALLDQLVVGGSPFWCHQGIRRPVRWEHRSEDVSVAELDAWAAEQGVERVTTVPGSPANYCPPLIDGVPYRADGQPAFVCAGWAARRRALIEEDVNA